MRIIITNDDGIKAPGLTALYEKLRTLADVTVIAPERERSATGHAITIHKPLRVEKTFITGNEGCGWAVSGTPSDCIKLGLKALVKQPPDLIISGINSGYNLGTDILYSGTVSAALEGILHSIPSLAVSTSTNDSKIYNNAAEIVKSIVEQIKDKTLTAQTLLNINIPPTNIQQIKGIRITRLGVREYDNVFEARRDPRGKIYYWLGGEAVECRQENENIDISAVREGYVSITPIHFDLTNHKLIPVIKNWKLNLPPK